MPFGRSTMVQEKTRTSALLPEGQHDQQEDRLAPAALHALGQRIGGRIADQQAEQGDPEAELNRPAVSATR